jgi:DNA polymerase III sliding clamp (beta) subunit (PCNA family)
MVVSQHNAELSIRALDGKLSLSTYADGIAAIELLDDKAEGFPDIGVDLDKFYTFLSARHEDEIKMAVTTGLKLSAGRSSAFLPKKELRFIFSPPGDDLLLGQIPSAKFDDLARVSTISDDKELARPLLQGAYMTVAPGDMRTMSMNGVAFGYAWEQSDGIKAGKREDFLIKATALSTAQKYDWQGEEKIRIFRPSEKLRMVCFATGRSFLFLSELAEKEKFPFANVVDASSDAVSPKHFTTNTESFRTYMNAASKLSGYDDKTVTVVLTNGKIMISSGNRLKSEVEETGAEFVGFFEIVDSLSSGDDFTFRLNSDFVRQALVLLNQVDKGGSLRVSLGEKTGLVFFSTPLANALYGIAQMARK